MPRLALLLAAIVSGLMPTLVLAQSPTRIADVKQLAGEWRGWAGNTRVGIVIKEDGTYEGIGAGGKPVTGKIVVQDGEASYKSNISAGHVLLLEEKGKSLLKFVTSGGTAEMERVK